MRRLLLLSVLIGTAHSWNAFAPIARRVPVARSGSRARVARGRGLRGPLLQRAVDVERAKRSSPTRPKAPGAARDAAGARAAAGAPGVTFAECLRFALPALGDLRRGPAHVAHRRRVRRPLGGPRFARRARPACAISDAPGFLLVMIPSPRPTSSRARSRAGARAARALRPATTPTRATRGARRRRASRSTVVGAAIGALLMWKAAAVSALYLSAAATGAARPRSKRSCRSQPSTCGSRARAARRARRRGRAGRVPWREGHAHARSLGRARGRAPSRATCCWCRATASPARPPRTAASQVAAAALLCDVLRRKRLLPDVLAALRARRGAAAKAPAAAEGAVPRRGCGSGRSAA